MSHWGPSHAEIMADERRRKALQTSAQELLDAILKAIDEAEQPTYRLPEIMSVSPESHADRFREDLKQDIISAAWSLNVEPTKSEVTK